MYGTFVNGTLVAVSYTKEAALAVAEQALRIVVEENPNIEAVGYRAQGQGKSNVNYLYYDGLATFAAVGDILVRLVDKYDLLRKVA